MRNYLLGAAAAALISTVAMADPGGGHGGGQGKGNGGGNGGAAAHGPAGGGGHGPAMKVAKADHGPAMKAEKSNGGGNDHAAKGPAMKAEHASVAKVDHGKPENPGKSVGPEKSDRGAAVGAPGLARDDGGDAKAKGWKVADARDVVRWTSFGGDRGLIDGCPPGLAKKDNGCMPPGLAKDRSYYDRGDWWNFGQRLDGDWRYYDGSLIRLGDDGRILSYRPLLGGSLLPGAIWPSSYGPVSLPSYYQSYYGLGPSDGYRYYDNTLYRVDPGTMAISSIAALLTGNDITVGQPMPLGYDVYNVPYPYRDRYVDGPNAYYRYSDGYVYQVDPTTQLVQAAIQLLT